MESLFYSQETPNALKKGTQLVFFLLLNLEPNSIETRILKEYFPISPHVAPFYLSPSRPFLNQRNHDSSHTTTYSRMESHPPRSTTIEREKFIMEVDSMYGGSHPRISKATREIL